MAHKWNLPVNRHVAHAVTCQLCGVFVERVFEGKRGVNYNTVLGGERERGLAPKCPGVSQLALAADEANDENGPGLFDVVDGNIVEHEDDEEPADVDGDEVESIDTTAGDEPEAEDGEEDELAVLCEKYEAMNRKALDKLAAGMVKNYKKLSKDALAFELALKEQRELAHQA